jgi:hypothetical protein
MGERDHQEAFRTYCELNEYDDAEAEFALVYWTDGYLAGMICAENRFRRFLHNARETGKFDVDALQALFDFSKIEAFDIQRTVNSTEFTDRTLS